MNNIVCFASEISVSTQKKRVIIEELLKGQEAATQLKVLLLEKPFWSEAFLSFQEVMDNVLRSFSEALSILNSSSSSEPAGSAAEVAHRSLLNTQAKSFIRQDSRTNRKSIPKPDLVIFNILQNL